MSSNVEERVVEMRFDNKKFEQNAKETMKTLDKLDKSLDLKGSTEGFERLEKAAKHVDLSSISSAVDAVNNKFSVMGTIGDQILRNLTNRAADFAINWTKAMTLDQVNKGWSKYEAKTQAVQVMLHALKDEGVTIDDVNAVLADLNTYTDNTSYHFDQMVDSMSKFTSAGIKMEDAEQMVEGIANWAASSGVSADKAGAAFYNLSQAMSSGALRAQDWKSIELLNMNSKEFEEKAIEIAQAMVDDGRASEEMAAAFKKANPKVQGFRDSLSTGWLDKDVMTELFKAYADQSTEFGHSAYMAAYEAKSLTDAVEAAKEAVASGWANIFEQIFGNYEEAKVFWTEVADAMIEVFSAPTNALSDLLTEWHEQGGYVAFIDSIRNAWAAVKGIGEEVISVYRSVFPAIGADKLISVTEKLNKVTAGWANRYSKIGISSLLLDPDDLDAITQAGGDLTQYFHEIAEARKHNAEVDNNLQNLRESLQGIFAILNLVKTVSTALFKIVIPFTKLLVPIAKIVGIITSALGRLATKVADAIINSKWFNNIIEKLNGYAEKAASYLSDLGDRLADFLDNFTHMPWFEQFVELLTTTWTAIKNFAAPYIEQAARAISKFIEKIKTWASENAGETVKSAGAALSKFGVAAFNVGKSIIEWLIPAFQQIWQELKRVWAWMKEVGGQFRAFWKEKVVPSDIYKTIKARLVDLVTKVKEFGAKFIKILKEGGIKKAFGWLMEQIDGLFIKIKNIDFGKLFGTVLSSSILLKVLSFILTLRKLRKTLMGVRTFMISFPKALKSFSKGLGIKRIAMSILILAGALYVLSKIPADRLWALMIALGVMAAGLVGLTIALGFAMKKIAGKGTLRDLAGFGKVIGSLVSLSASVLILAAALKIISTIPAEHLMDVVIALISILGALALVSLAIGASGSATLKAGIGLLAFVGALVLLTFAFDKIQDTFATLKQNWKELLPGLAAIVGVLAIVGFLVTRLSKAKKTTWQLAAVILAIGASLLLIVLAVEKMANLNWENFAKAGIIILGLAGTLLAIGLLAKVFKSVSGKKFLGIAAAILALGISIGLITATMVGLSMLPKELLEKGLIRLAIIIGLLSIAMLAMGKVQPQTGGAIMASVLLIIAVVAALMVLQKQDLDKLLATAIILGGVMLALGVALGIMSKLAKGTSAWGIVALVPVLLAVAGSLYALSNISDKSKLLAAAMALGAVLIALGISLLAGGHFASKIKFPTLLGMMGVILSIATAMAIMAQLNTGKMIASALVLSALMLVLAGVSRRMSKGFGASGNAGWQGMWQSVIIMFSIMAFIVGSLKLLESYGLGHLVVTAAVLAALMIVMTLCTKALSKLPSGTTKSALPVLLMFSAIIFPIVGALALAKRWIPDTSGLIDIAVAIGAIVLAMLIPIAAIELLSKVGLGLKSLGAAGAFALIIALLVGVVIAIGYLVGLINSESLDSALTTAENVLTRVGAAIGGFIGSIVTGIGNTISNALVGWGDNIEYFCTHVAKGMRKFKNLDVNTAAFDCIGTLATAILKITKTNVIDGIAQWIGLTDKDSVQTFAEDLAAMAPALKKFSEDTSGIVDIKHTETCAKAIETLANAAMVIGNIKEGSLFEAITGKSKGMGEFAAELAAATPGIVLFGLAAKGLGVLGATEDMVNVASAVESLASVARKMPKVDGFWQKVTGRTEKMDEFANEMAAAIPGLEAFAAAAPKIADKADAIKDVATAVGALVDVANSLKSEKLDVGWGAYVDDAQTLSEFMEAFGGSELFTGSIFGKEFSIGRKKEGLTQQLQTFAETFHDLKENNKLDGIDDAIDIIKKLGQLGNTFQTHSTEISALWGLVDVEISDKSGLAVIAEAMPGLTTALDAFITTIGPENIATLQQGVDLLYVLAQTEQLLEEAYVAAEEWDFDGRTFLSDFATNLAATGTYDTWAEDRVKLEEMTENFDAIAAMFNSFNGVDFTGINSYIEWVKNAVGAQATLDEGKAIIKTIADSVADAIPLVLPTASDAATTDMADEFKKDVHINKFKSVGAAFDQGMADGITQNVQVIKTAAESITNETIATMKRILGIKSPSRVMRHIGDYAGEGFYLGLEDWVKSSGTAGTDLANSMTDSALNVLDYISALMNGDLVVDMTIRPVLDLTYMQPGIASINSLFAQRQAIAVDAQANSLSQRDEVAELVNVSWQILKEIQNGRDLYLDGKVLAGSMNRRLGKTVMEGL